MTTTAPAGAVVLATVPPCANPALRPHPRDLPARPGDLLNPFRSVRGSARAALSATLLAATLVPALAQPPKAGTSAASAQSGIDRRAIDRSVRTQDDLYRHVNGAWLKRTGYADDGKFHDLVQAAIHAVPRTKIKDKFVLPEAQTLESIRANIFEDIAQPQADVEQLTLVPG